MAVVISNHEQASQRRTRLQKNPPQIYPTIHDQTHFSKSNMHVERGVTFKSNYHTAFHDPANPVVDASVMSPRIEHFKNLRQTEKNKNKAGKRKIMKKLQIRKSKTVESNRCEFLLFLSI